MGIGIYTDMTNDRDDEFYEGMSEEEYAEYKIRKREERNV